MKHTSVKLVVISFSLLFIFPVQTNSLMYRDGFIYSHTGEKPFYIPEHYQQITEKLWVDKHQTVTISKDKSVYLMGFAVDIINPNLSLQNTVNRLSENLLKSENLFYDYETNLSGRYICLYKNTKQQWNIITDPNAMRPVFYTNNATILTGHAHLLALNLKKQDFTFERKQFRFDIIPANKTPFDNVFQLLPNHTLSIGAGTLKRFFPRKNRQQIKKQEAIDFLISSISNAIKGVVIQQKNLLLSLTAGYDSRTTLSIMLLNNIKPDACYTYFKHGSDQDIIEAKNICKILHISHITIPSNYHSDQKDFEAKNALAKNSHLDWIGLPDSDVLAMRALLGSQNYLNINSNIPETWRWFIGKNGNVIASHMINEYLPSNKELFNYFPSLLYYIEQRVHPWITHHWVKTDIAFDTFSPYNCRKIIEIMVSIPTDYEKADDIHTAIMKKAQSIYHCFTDF